jgi:hypothetical protein
MFRVSILLLSKKRSASDLVLQDNFFAMEYSNEVIESLLKQFRAAIGGDYDRYSNHVYRVFLICLLMDKEKANEDKYATAAVFHDIGIWTDHTIDYLDPSIRQAEIYLAATARQDWIEEITLMINWHHKITAYHGKYEMTVENFRKADWIDVSLGLKTFGSDKKKIKKIRRVLPNKGFHWFLIRQITKNFFRYPLKPFPMFKK